MTTLSPAMERLANKIMPKLLNESYGGRKLVKRDGRLRPIMNIFSVGFDTLRLGLPKIKKDYQSNTMNLKALCDAIGATLHPFLYFESIDSKTPIYTDDKELQRLFFKNSKFHGSFRKQFQYTGGVWIIKYKDIAHWVIDPLPAKRLSFELYGLSQLDHHLGATRFELLTKILEFYAPNKQHKVYLDGYDFHIDLNKPFDDVISTFIVPKIYLQNKKKKRGKQRIHKGMTGTVYLQPFRRNLKSKEYVYNKTLKNDLGYPLSRLERSVRFDLEDKKILLNCYDDLSALFEDELERIRLLVNLTK
jgi:hypothetical protein